MQIFIHTLSCFSGGSPGVFPGKLPRSSHSFLSIIPSFSTNFNDIFPASVICAKKILSFSKNLHIYLLTLHIF